MKKNNILFLSNLWPSAQSNAAGNQQQLGKYITDFSTQKDAQIFLLRVFSDEELDESTDRRDDEFLQQFLHNKSRTCRVENLRLSFWIKELLFPKYLYFSPPPTISIDFDTYLKEKNIDLIVVFACYWLAELCCDYEIPVHLVAGVPDPSSRISSARINHQKGKIVETIELAIQAVEGKELDTAIAKIAEEKKKGFSKAV